MTGEEVFPSTMLLMQLVASMRPRLGDRGRGGYQVGGHTLSDQMLQ